MTSLFKSIQRYALLRSTAYILLGISIALYPNNVSKIILNIIVFYNILMGIINLISALKNKKDGYSSGMGMTVFYFISALLIFLFAKPIVSILPVLLGLGFIIGGGFRIMQSFNLKQYVNANWIAILIYGLFMIGAGVLLISYSFSTAMMFFRVFGIMLTISGISDLIAFFRFKKYGI